MNILPYFAASALILGLILLFFWYLQNQKFGILNKKIIYKDTDQAPGQILFAKSLALSGKPDYLIKENNMIFPVEIKTSRAPLEPYENHIMQLMAYCLLVEENYGVRPVGGFLKYPGKEFKIAYTDEARESLKDLVGEMLLLKHSGKELHCNHPEHNR
jgi:CRISPR-associated exonuclease Cas4